MGRQLQPTATLRASKNNSTDETGVECSRPGQEGSKFVSGSGESVRLDRRRAPSKDGFESHAQIYRRIDGARTTHIDIETVHGYA